MKTYSKKILRALSVLVMFAMVISMANVGNIEAQAAKKKNVVVLYFSATGTTKGAAKRIRTKTKGKMIEIKAKDPYSDDDLDYGRDDSRVVKEHICLFSGKKRSTAGNFQFKSHQKSSKKSKSCLYWLSDLACVPQFDTMHPSVSLGANFNDRNFRHFSLVPSCNEKKAKINPQGQGKAYLDLFVVSFETGRRFGL